jgi:surface antigen
MTKIGKGSLIALLAAALVACESPPSKQDIGAVTGGVLGGLLGAQVGQGSGRTLAIIAGAVAGAFAGSHIGKTMDQSDRQKTAQALETAPTGSPTAWRNPDTGSTYTVTPTRTYASASEPCRDFTTKAVIDGRDEVVHGTACRQPDGNWQTK